MTASKAGKAYHSTIVLRHRLKTPYSDQQSLLSLSNNNLD
jgi:hypothetical protein